MPKKWKTHIEDSLSSGRATKHQQQNGPRNSHCFQMQVCESKVLLQCADVKLDCLLHIIEGSNSSLYLIMHFLPSKSVQSQKIGSWISVNQTNAIAALITGVFLKHWTLSSGGNLVVFFLIAWFNQNLCSSQLVAWMFNMICMIWWKSLMRLSVSSSINSCIQTNAFLIMAWMWTCFMI